MPPPPRRTKKNVGGKNAGGNVEPTVPKAAEPSRSFTKATINAEIQRRSAFDIADLRIHACLSKAIGKVPEPMCLYKDIQNLGGFKGWAFEQFGIGDFSDTTGVVLHVRPNMKDREIADDHSFQSLCREYLEEGTIRFYVVHQTIFNISDTPACHPKLERGMDERLRALLVEVRAHEDGSPNLCPAVQTMLATFMIQRPHFLYPLADLTTVQETTCSGRQKVVVFATYPESAFTLWGLVWLTGSDVNLLTSEHRPEAGEEIVSEFSLNDTDDMKVLVTTWQFRDEVLARCPSCTMILEVEPPFVSAVDPNETFRVSCPESRPGQTTIRYFPLTTPVEIYEYGLYTHAYESINSSTLPPTDPSKPASTPRKPSQQGYMEAMPTNDTTSKKTTSAKPTNDNTDISPPKTDERQTPPGAWPTEPTVAKVPVSEPTKDENPPLCPSTSEPTKDENPPLCPSIPARKVNRNLTSLEHTQEELIDALRLQNRILETHVETAEALNEKLQTSHELQQSRNLALQKELVGHAVLTIACLASFLGHRCISRVMQDCERVREEKEELARQVGVTITRRVKRVLEQGSSKGRTGSDVGGEDEGEEGSQGFIATALETEIEGLD